MKPFSQQCLSSSRRPFVLLFCLGLLCLGGCSTTGGFVRSSWLGASKKLVDEPYKIEAVEVTWLPANFDGQPKMRDYARRFALALEIHLHNKGVPYGTQQSPAKTRLVVEPEELLLENGIARGGGRVNVAVVDIPSGRMVARYERVLVQPWGEQLGAFVLVENFIDANRMLVFWGKSDEPNAAK